MDANHLTSDEIQLVAESRSREQVDANVAIPERVRQHADSCETCARRVSMQIDFRRRLSLLKSSGSSLGSPDCPDPDTVWQLSFAEPQSGQAKAILQHVADCDHCSGLLRSAAEEFDQELSPEQQDLLHAVQTSRMSSHPRMANELASIVQRSGHESPTVPKTVQTPRFRRWVFAFSAATALLVAAWLGSLTIRRGRPAYAESLITQAYTAARPFEPRFRGAAFAPIRVERGGGRSETERPPALLDAEALIGRKLARSPDDPEWLHVRGQADLLDGHYGLAIQAFERALVVQPGSVELEVDLATALFQRTQAENNTADLAEAADRLSRVIQKDPKDSIALFNRALVLEQMFLLDQSLDDWQRYLRIDGSGEWANEAGKHVADIQRKLQKKAAQDQLSLLLPTEVSAKNLNSDAKQLQGIDLRIEQYLALALRQWPAELFTRPTSQRTGSGSDGLQNIASILRGGHEDSWLMQFLSAESASHRENGFATLRNAILSSDHGDYTAARRYADQAERLFQLEGNVPGVLRATFEHIYALQFSSNGLDCSREARLLAIAARDHGYKWIEQQSMIEEGICLNLLGEFGPASRSLEAAIAAASQTGYAVTKARATVMLGLVLWDSGKSMLAWGRLREAAENCWAGYCPQASLYSVYANMDNFSEDSRLWYVQVFAAQQAVVTAESDPDFLMRAVEHSRLASAATLAGLPALARQNFEIAHRLLSKAPQSEVTANYEAGINIDLAKLAFAQGDSPAASQYLKLAENRISHIDDYYLLTDFFLTKASIGVNPASVVPDEASLQWAVALAERQLSSLASQKDRFTWSHNNGAVYRQLVETDLQKGDLSGALSKWEWFLAAPGRIGRGLKSANAPPPAADLFVLNRSSAAPPPLPPVVNTEEIVRRLRGQTMLSYVLLSNRLGAWVLNDKGVDFRWLTTDANRVLRLSRNFAELCSNPSAERSSWESQATALYDVLISPLEDRLIPGRTLLIDGEREILSVPFPALMDRKGRRLLEKFSVSIIPGSYLLPSKPAKDSLDLSDDALIVDSAVSNDIELNLHPLPPSLTESTLIARKFPSAHILRGSEVQLSVLKREIPQAVVFHYTGHSSSGQRFVGIFVSEEKARRAILDSSVIRAFGPMRTQLVVLSACGTVGGKRGDFADEDSLAYAFLEGAVPHVIASRWNVDSLVTARLMDKFYSNVLAGQSIAEALRLAELEISGSPDTDRPYFWAAFGAYGTS